MRWLLVASAISASRALPDEVKEIIAQGMTEQWLIDTLAASAVFGRHHIRRRDAECVDKHDSCSQYTQHCTNTQFQETCLVTCKTCDTQKKPVETVADEAPADGACQDTMQYCPSMVKYCDNEDYQGVKLYCRKTCDSCDEPIALPEKNETDSTTDSCVDKSWCGNFPYCKDSQQLRERIVDDCPVECKELRCQHRWKPDTTVAPSAGPATTESCADQSQACAGIAELCDQDNYVSTLKTYCQKTCNFCSDGPAELPEPVSAPGECKNQYPNCEGMKFLCTEENNEYNERYRELCPETCGMCENTEQAAPSSPPVTTASTVCEDKAKNCNELIDFCGQDNTKVMMEVQCALTCRLCTPENAVPEAPTTMATSRVMQTLPPSTECVDQPGHDCSNYLNYCDNTNTKVPELCRKTCNLCGGDEVPSTPTNQPEISKKMPTTQPPVVTTPVVTTSASSTAAAPPSETGECILATKDKSGTCKKYAKFCNNPKYKKKLSFQCPMTCKICQKPTTPTAAADGAAAADGGASTPECKDKVPKQCVQLKRHCKSPKYLKVLKFKCPKTCGFCGGGDGSATTTPAATGQAPADGEKFGNWSVNWSKCSPACQQYKSRKCLQQPCNRASLFKFQKCPAEQYPNNQKCQAMKANAAGGASDKPATTVCRDKSNQCSKYAKMCAKNAKVKAQCPKTCGKCTDRRRRAAIEHAQRARRSSFGLNMLASIFNRPAARSSFSPAPCADRINCRNFVQFGWCRSIEPTVKRMVRHLFYVYAMLKLSEKVYYSN